MFQENVCPSTHDVMEAATPLVLCQRAWLDIPGVRSLSSAFLRLIVFFITNIVTNTVTNVITNIVTNISNIQGVKCSVMWGVGCGKSSYFCWRGNVCLPKSVACNGKYKSNFNDNEIN